MVVTSFCASEGGGGATRRRRVIVPAILGAGALLSVIAWTSYSRWRETAGKSAAAVNLRSIGAGMHAYAEINGGAWPGGLSELVEAGALEGEALRDPFDADRPARVAWVTYDESASRLDTKWIAGYMEFEEAGGGAILYVDGHVESLAGGAFAEAVEGFMRDYEERCGRRAAVRYYGRDGE